jgi:EpsI family protein
LVDVGIAVFAQQREGAELVGFGTGVLRENDRWLQVERLSPIAAGAALRIRAPGPVERVVATWYQVGDVETADPMRVKLAAAAARLTGRSQRAIALHLSAEVAPGRNPAAAIAAFRQSIGAPVRAAGLP